MPKTCAGSKYYYVSVVPRFRLLLNSGGKECWHVAINLPSFLRNYCYYFTYLCVVIYIVVDIAVIILYYMITYAF